MFKRLLCRAANVARAVRKRSVAGSRSKTVYRVLVVLLLLSALLIRIDYNVHHEAPLLGDTYYISQYAKSIAEHGEYPLHNGIYWSPGIVYFMGWLLPVIGEEQNFFYYRLLQSFLSVIGVFGFFLLSKRLFGSKAALFTLGLLAFYPPLIFLTGMIYAENLFFALLPYLFLLLMQWKRRGGYVWPLAAGVMFGMLHLIRSILHPLPILFVVWFLLTGAKEAYRRFFMRELPVFIASTVLVLLPWVVHNYQIYGSIVTSSAVGGLNFYIGHNEKANSTWVQIDTEGEVFQQAGTPEGNKLGYIKGLQYMFHHPIQEMKLTWKKFQDFWWRTGNFWGDEANRLWDSRYSIPAMPMPVLSAAFLIFLVTHRRSWKEWFLPVGYVIAYQGMILALYYADRYRMIVEPFLIIFFVPTLIKIVQVVHRWIERWLERRKGEEAEHG